MKIYVPNVSNQGIGGGFTFMYNFKKGMPDEVQFVDSWRESDIVFIAGPTLADRGEVDEAKAAGKKIVFRVDNIPRKSRNKRSRVYDNMKHYGQMADMVIYQSKWAKEYAGYFIDRPINKPSAIIYNGADEDIFKNDEVKFTAGVSPKIRYLYVQYNRDENKRFTEAAYRFHMEWRKNTNSTLTLVGNFSPELVDAGFDFFCDEKVEFIPPQIDQEAMAKIYRDHDVLLFPAFADACPNTVIEALMCGMDICGVNRTGGTIEILDVFNQNKEELTLTSMCNKYMEYLKNL